MVGRARRAPKGAFPIKTAEDARPARIFSIERSSRASKTRLDTWEFSLGILAVISLSNMGSTFSS